MNARRQKPSAQEEKGHALLNKFVYNDENKEPNKEVLSSGVVNRQLNQ